MSRDGPPSGRIIFSTRGSKSASKVNLSKLLTERPHLQTKAEEMTKQGHRSDVILNHVRENGDAEQFQVIFFRGDTGEEYYSDRYSDDEAALRAEIESSLGINLYTAASLWSYDKVQNEWHEEKFFSRRKASPKP